MASDEAKIRRNGAPDGALVLPKFDPDPSGRFAARIIAEAGIQAALVGRLAVWAWVSNSSQHAFTKDLDVALSVEDLHKLRAWFAAHNVSTRELPIGGVNVSDDTGVNVDFIVRNAVWGDFAGLFSDAVKEAADRQRHVTVGGESLLLVSAEHLVAMKLATSEDKDEEDARRVFEGNPVDVATVRRLVAIFLGAQGSARLEVFLRDIGHPEAFLRRSYQNGSDPSSR